MFNLSGVFSWQSSRADGAEAARKSAETVKYYVFRYGREKAKDLICFPWTNTKIAFIKPSVIDRIIGHVLWAEKVGNSSPWSKAGFMGLVSNFPISKRGWGDIRSNPNHAKA